MASVVQFVDSIASSPTVRLDLNNLTGSNALAVDVAGMDLSPPPMRRAFTSTMLMDGDRITAAAFENRVVKFTVRLIRAASVDAAATVVQNLGRELNRPTNILKVHLDGATAPVFFRTFRAPDYTLSMLRLLFIENTAAALELVAEPFALGLREDPVSLVTVDTNPAAGSNGCFVDVTGVKGDVEAPAFIRWPDAATANDRETVFAVRRRGTPSATPFLFQAEALTQGTDTTTQVNDANFSGAGNNYSRCTFATATMQGRLSTADLGTASVDLRGRYRVLLRYRKNTSGDGINLMLRWGDVGFTTVDNAIFATPNTTSTCMADLGDISVPLGLDPVFDPSGTELAVADAFQLLLMAERTSGSGTIDFDFLLLVPADDRLAVLKWQAGGADRWLLDARDDSAHGRSSSDQVASAGGPSIAGELPMLTPNQTNRIYMLREVAPGLSSTLTTVTNVSVSYWPRYLSVRPAST
jgi:hypothetical protein